MICLPFGRDQCDGLDAATPQGCRPTFIDLMAIRLFASMTVTSFDIPFVV